MAKYSVPGVRTTEIDNTIRTETIPGAGIGAIVMKSNKGPVNQRIVTTDYNNFKEVFGAPENKTDYGHFAAKNFLANSTQLYAVRATMGDEQYSQIQFSYPDAAITATNYSKDTAKFIYIDSEGDSNLNLLSPLSANTNVQSLTSGGQWQSVPTNGSEGFCLRQKAFYGIVQDITTESKDSIVFKGTTNTTTKDETWSGNISNSGKHVVYPTYVDSSGNNPELTYILLTSGAWNDYFVPSSHVGSAAINDKLVKISLSVPSSATLNNEAQKIIFNGMLSALSGIPISGISLNELFTNASSYFYGTSGSWKNTISTSGYGYTDALNLEIMDWDDPDIRKQYYVDADIFTPTCKPASGIAYTEFFNADSSYAITGPKVLENGSVQEVYKCESVSSMYLSTDKTRKTEWGNDEISSRTQKEVIIDMLNQYACNDISDINNYYYLKYYDVVKDEIRESIIKENKTQMFDSSSSDKHVETYLFWLFLEKGNKNLTKKTVYLANNSELVTLPIQDGYTYKDETTGDITTVNPIVATPTSYLINSVDKTYANGYTIQTESDDEPGNGDIENYNSAFDNQFVIASIGPGKYGDDIGVSIITTECEKIPALHHQNAFCWKNRYDDDDLITADGDDLIWKKVFRINVYIKDKNQTAEGAWGFGMDALLREPVESWFVSTDPYAIDNEGFSLYAPTVINGHSDYIYISRSSTNKAVNSHGKYEQPNQTFAIYQLTGGQNSKKDNISEKTAALNFYKDRNNVKFDILFNCDAVETFNGKQRYAAHQHKIAEIAGSRKQDIGVVQVTSKEAKTVKQMVSESKNFNFNNGSYIAEYGGYDKYYDSDIASMVYLPKSVAGACAIAYCATVENPWMAPAGTARGTINYSLAQLLKLTDDEIGQLYDNNVNTTRDCGPYGVVLWGQKTAYKKNSLLNRINIRCCMNFIEKRLEQMMIPYLFMQNTVNTRSSARNDITSFLQQVKSGQGIYGYEVSVSQDDEDPTIMNVNITVYPTSAIEFIDIKININRNNGGVTVAEA